MRRRSARLWRFLRWLPVWLVAFTVLQVLPLRWIDPPTSAFMVARAIEGLGDDGFRLRHQWRGLSAISPELPIALVAAEDQRFPSHRGFDLEAIDRARERNAGGGRVRGASTITQQVAKNLYLWKGGGYARKAVEAWYAVLIEAFWSKSRILEVYANIAEFGDGVYGVQAAARSFFGLDAARLGPAQSARLAAVLPSPRRYNARNPGPYVQRRSRGIERQMRQLGQGYLQDM